MNKAKREDGLTRRNFIEYSAVLAGGLVLSPMLNQAASPVGETDEKLFWYQKPLRIMHLSLIHI